MTQETWFEVVDHSLDGFDKFWKEYPVDTKRRQRKTGKAICKKHWKKHRIGTVPGRLEHVLACLEEDKEDIKKGTLAHTPGSHDYMCYFPMPAGWLNGGKGGGPRWDRDTYAITKQPEPKLIEEHIPMTFEEKMSKIDAFRAIKEGRAMPLRYAN